MWNSGLYGYEWRGQSVVSERGGGIGAGFEFSQIYLREGARLTVTDWRWWEETGLDTHTHVVGILTEQDRNRSKVLTLTLRWCSDDTVVKVSRTDGRWELARKDSIFRMSTNYSRVCSLILEDNFGLTVRQVGDTMIRSGPLTLPRVLQTLTPLKIPPTKVRTLFPLLLLYSLLKMHSSQFVFI
jgi:hypothetical protein